MSSPTIVFSQFLTACLLGVGLGVFYDLTASLPRVLRHLGDGIFILGLFACGIYLGFGVCDGDLRPIYSFGLLLGVLCWHYTLGRVVRFLFSKLFRSIFSFFSGIFHFLKKIFRFLSLFFKKTFAIREK